MNIFEERIFALTARRQLRIATLIVGSVCIGVALDSGWWIAGLLALAFSEIFRD
jgi:hypothetical protein